MKNSIIAFDFSIAKPACCAYIENNYSFYFWPKDKSISDKNQEVFKNANINLIHRETIKSDDITKYDIINADILGDLIIETLTPFLNK